jgi:glycosyltransferase involved in cell wall biosynthesis
LTVSFSVVICAYTSDRWDLLVDAVASVQAQDLAPEQVVVCVDHNAPLAGRCRELWPDGDGVLVIENRYPGRLGSARNSALEQVSGDIVAFLDDDARAAPDWLARLERVYAESPEVQAVGGAPKPDFAAPRPSWFPFEFDWVFGCAYRGLPTERLAVPRLIGASMSVRLEAVLAVGGFHSDNHDDMDLSHRLVSRFGPDSVIYDPEITVSHFVSHERLTWRYFSRRCFHVNRGKVLAFRNMEEAGNQQADLMFVRRALLEAVPGYLASPSDGGLKRAAATVAGIALAGLGNLVGRVSLLVGATPPERTTGIELPRPSPSVH